MRAMRRRIVSTPSFKPVGLNLQHPWRGVGMLRRVRETLRKIPALCTGDREMVMTFFHEQ